MNLHANYGEVQVPVIETSRPFLFRRNKPLRLWDLIGIITHYRGRSRCSIQPALLLLLLPINVFCQIGMYSAT